MADASCCMIMVYVAGYHGIDAACIAAAVYVLGRVYLRNKQSKGPLRTS
jgi:hypothetical protein